MPFTKILVAAYLERGLTRPFLEVVPELSSRLICTPLVITQLDGGRCNLTLYDSPNQPTLFCDVEESTAESLKK